MTSGTVMDAERQRYKSHYSFFSCLYYANIRIRLLGVFTLKSDKLH